MARIYPNRINPIEEENNSSYCFLFSHKKLSQVFSFPILPFKKFLQTQTLIFSVCEIKGFLWSGFWSEIGSKNLIMRKRERENPCSICGHYHKYEEGEVCGICGHCMPVSSDTVAAQQVHVSAFPSEILPEFLYLGSYDNASRSELLKTQGISRVLNVSFFGFYQEFDLNSWIGSWC